MKRTPQERVDEHNALARALNSVPANFMMTGTHMKELPPHDPAANVNLSGVQFRHIPGDSRGLPHNIIAKNSDGDVVGRLQWHARTGTVQRIAVPHKYQGVGMATSLWEQANRLADLGHAPRPKHSNDRTIAGDAWSEKVGGKRPKLDKRRAAQNESRKKAMEKFK